MSNPRVVYKLPHGFRWLTIGEALTHTDRRADEDLGWVKVGAEWKGAVVRREGRWIRQKGGKR